MLINELLEFCNMSYTSTPSCNENCSHPYVCPHSCETCLEQVHFPARYINGRLEYTCKKLLLFYVCKYTYKYESEIKYAFDSINRLKSYQRYNIISLGCGASPDLIAMEKYLIENSFNKSIDYWGIDLNPNWQPIHNMIKNYSIRNNYTTKYIHDDVITMFKHTNFQNFNILILQYLISYFYNNDDIYELSIFYDDLIEHVVKHMLTKSTIIINDVNSNKRGRDYFILLSQKLAEHNINHSVSQKYFDYNIQNDYMRYGTRYTQNQINIACDTRLSSYNPWEVCSSAQLIIELE